MYKEQDANSETRIEIFCKYIIRGGKKIFPKSGTCFHFFL